MLFKTAILLACCSFSAVLSAPQNTCPYTTSLREKAFTFCGKTVPLRKPRCTTTPTYKGVSLAEANGKTQNGNTATYNFHPMGQGVDMKKIIAEHKKGDVQRRDLLQRMCGSVRGTEIANPVFIDGYTGGSKGFMGWRDENNCDKYIWVKFQYSRQPFRFQVAGFTHQPPRSMYLDSNCGFISVDSPFVETYGEIVDWWGDDLI